MSVTASHPIITVEAACTRSAGERLTFLRRRLGLNLTDVAGLTGLSRSELSRLEKGERRMREYHIDVLARAYGVDIATLRGMLNHERAQEVPAAGRLLPCYGLSHIAGAGTSRAVPRLTRLTLDIAAGPDAYMIAVDGPCALLVPDRSVVIADPAARAVLGDLVVNVLTWTPPLMILRRDEAGRLKGVTENGATGFGDGVGASAFHKVIAILSISHFGLGS